MRNVSRRVRVVVGAAEPPRRAQLRHPHVLQFKDSIEVEGDKAGAVTLYLVTEPVQPLSAVLQELRLDGSQRCALHLSARTWRRLTHARLRSDDYIALGLSQVAQAVAFLNADCKMVRAYADVGVP